MNAGVAARGEGNPGPPLLREAGSKLKVIGYVYVVKDETPKHDEQVWAIKKWAAETQAQVVGWAEDYAPAVKRPALEGALVRLDDDADAIVVSHGHRLGRLPQAGVWAGKAGGQVIVLDHPEVDGVELAKIGQLAASWTKGFRRTRRRDRFIPADVVDRIVADREAGLSTRDIRDGLNLDRVPTVSGKGAWALGTIQTVLRDPERAKGPR